MTGHICSISVYILKSVTSTLIFIGANGMFQILSLKSVFSGPIAIMSCKFFVEVLLQVETSSIIKNLPAKFQVLIHSKIFKLKNMHFVLLGSRGVIVIHL